MVYILEIEVKKHMSLALLGLGGLMLNIVKVAVAYYQGNRSEVANIVWDAVSNTIKGKKETFDDIFLQCLKESIESQKPYLTSKCESEPELIESEFLRALKAASINVEDVDLLTMDKEIFIHKIAKILMNNISLPGITSYDTLSICRKLVEELRVKIKNRIAQNPELFNKFLLQKIELNGGKDSQSLKYELINALTNFNLSMEIIESLCTEIKEIKEIVEEINKNNGKNAVLSEISLNQILDNVTLKMKAIKCRNKTIETQFGIKIDLIIGLLRNMNERQFISFILSIKIPFSQNESVDKIELSSFSIDFISEIIKKLALILMIHPNIEFTNVKGVGLKVSEKIVSYIHSNDKITYEDYEVIIFNFLRQIIEAKFEHLDKIDRVIVGNCIATECDGNKAVVDFDYILDEIASVYPEEEEFTDFREKYNFNYHCQKCLSFQTKANYREFKNELKRVLGGNDNG